MANYRSAVATPVSYQWDPDSRFPLPDPGSAPDNCGPAAIENVAQFYNNRSFGIYRTRLLAAPAYGPTSFFQQMQMLNKRGVPCVQWRGSVSKLREIVKGGRQPVVIGMLYSRVPDDIAGHPFQGWHAVEVLDTARRNGVRGFWIRDPNFNRTYRQDPTGGRRFYPDWVIQSAFYNAGGWGIKPNTPKAIIRYARLNRGEGINVRKSKGEPGDGRRYGELWGTTRNGKLIRVSNGEVVADPQTKPFRFRGFVEGAYHGLGEHPKDWARLVIRGNTRYVARPLITRL